MTSSASTRFGITCPLRPSIQLVTGDRKQHIITHQLPSKCVNHLPSTAPIAPHQVFHSLHPSPSTPTPTNTLSTVATPQSEPSSSGISPSTSTSPSSKACSPPSPATRDPSHGILRLNTTASTASPSSTPSRTRRQQCRFCASSRQPGATGDH